MKKIKFFAAAMMLCAAGYFGYTAYQNATLTDSERIFKANLEALTQKEPGDSAEGDCPNGGYYSTGMREESIKKMWVKIDLTTNAVVSMSESEGEASAGFSIERLSTVAYSCDQSNDNICLVCNRYVL